MGAELSLSKIVTIIIMLAILLIFGLAYASVSGDTKDTGGGWFSMIKERLGLIGVATSPVRLSSVTVENIHADGSFRINAVVERPHGHHIEILVNGVALLEHLESEDSQNRVITLSADGVLGASQFGSTNIRVNARKDGETISRRLYDESLYYLRIQEIQESIRRYGVAFDISETDAEARRVYEMFRDEYKEVADASVRFCNNLPSLFYERMNECPGEEAARFSRQINKRDYSVCYNRHSANLISVLKSTEHCKGTKSNVWYHDNLYVAGEDMRNVPVIRDVTPPILNPELEYFRLNSIADHYSISLGMKIINAEGYDIYFSPYGNMPLSESLPNVYENNDVRAHVPSVITGRVSLSVDVQKDSSRVNIVQHDFTFFRPGLPEVGSWLGVSSGSEINSANINTLCRISHDFCCLDGRECLIEPCHYPASPLPPEINYFERYFNEYCDAYAIDENQERYDCLVSFISDMRENLPACMNARPDVVYSEGLYVKW
jgi:hypothetical protein